MHSEHDRYIIFVLNGVGLDVKKDQKIRKDQKAFTVFAAIQLFIYRSPRCDMYQDDILKMFLKLEFGIRFYSR